MYRDTVFLFHLLMTPAKLRRKELPLARWKEADTSIKWSYHTLHSSNEEVWCYAKSLDRKETLRLQVEPQPFLAAASTYIDTEPAGTGKDGKDGKDGEGEAGSSSTGGAGDADGDGEGGDPVSKAKAAAARAARRVTEDDVANAQQAAGAGGRAGAAGKASSSSSGLPLFDDYLSTEQAQYLFSYLTVPAMRIPLVLGFFATKDRVDLLQNRKLQALLSACLFEPGPWQPPPAADGRDGDPKLALSAALIPAPAPSADSSASASGSSQHWLGARTGYLLHELAHSPRSTLRPLLALLENAIALDTGSFRAAAADVILFALRTAVRIEAFAQFGMSFCALC
jgi:hypothetical protein